MTVLHVIGVDPGLVHTGVVSMTFATQLKSILVESEAIAGTDHVGVSTWVKFVSDEGVQPHVYIEGYRPRSNLNSDARMVEAVSKMKAAIPHSTVLQNTGVKKVVKPELMQLLGVWKFGTVTHHQDLRSAARIALLGMMRQETTNRVLANVVRDHLDGVGWDVRVT